MAEIFMNVTTSTNLKFNHAPSLIGKLLKKSEFSKRGLPPTSPHLFYENICINNFPYNRLSALLGKSRPQLILIRMIIKII